MDAAAGLGGILHVFEQISRHGSQAQLLGIVRHEKHAMRISLAAVDLADLHILVMHALLIFGTKRDGDKRDQRKQYKHGMHRYHQGHAKCKVNHAPKNARHVVKHVHSAVVGFSESLDELIVKLGVFIAGKLDLVGMRKDL